MASLEPTETLEQAAAAARACTICAAQLPLGPRPTFRVSETARLLIVSQAPGTKVHETGIPFNDASGDRLRAWLGVDRDIFYDASRVALVPMGLCYPGRLPQGGDVPPMKICAPTWHPRLLPKMKAVRLTLLVGSYAIARMLGPGGMAAHVRRWREHLPARLPLPHPSWRTVGWEAANPWFTAEVLPELRSRLRDLLDKTGPAGE
ncbi:MAG: uracil-DNA glycosylase family protein [Alphaproteobacteria bacterium]|nr:uracil-DNA glycosylase family protein [Alphaproteobacteria bacterium]